MKRTVTLKHVYHSLPERWEPFYDGLYKAQDGVLTIPSGNVSQIRAAFHRGYCMTKDGRRLYTDAELMEYVGK